MHQIGVHTMHKLHRFSKWWWSVSGKILLDITINGKPILFDALTVAEVRLMSSETDAKMLHLHQVTTDPLQTLKVTLPWCNMARRHAHDSTQDVTSPQSQYSLQRTNERLTLVNAVFIQ